VKIMAAKVATRPAPHGGLPDLRRLGVGQRGLESATVIHNYRTD